MEPEAALCPHVFTLHTQESAVSSDANSTIVAAAVIGDATLDGIVDLGDFDRWFMNVGAATRFTSRGDFDGSGRVDLGDFDAWFGHVGRPAPLRAAPVPEGGTFGVLAGAGLLAVRRPKMPRAAASGTRGEAVL